MIVALRAVQHLHAPTAPATATLPAIAPTPATASGSTPAAALSTLSTFIIPDLALPKISRPNRIFGTSTLTTNPTASLRMVSSTTPTKSRRKFTAGGLEPYYKNLGAFLSQILLSLDASFGGMLLTQPKSLPGMLVIVYMLL